MPRSLVLSNGYLSACLDQDGFVRDLYYPHVGLENHVAGLKHRIGVWVDGGFSWLDSPEWTVKTKYLPHTMVGQTTYVHSAWNIEIVSEDVVYNELPVFVRHFVIHNKNIAHKEIRVFFGQEFSISETRFRNTGFYDPTKNCIVHYKGKRVFLVNGRSDHGSMDDYTVGVFQFDGKEGSFRDAEDGELSKNAVEHGPVDSVFRLCASCENKEKIDLYYWICAAENVDDAYRLNDVILYKTPQSMIHSTSAFWEAWAKTKSVQFADLPQDVIDLYYTSLFVLRSHVDHDGGVIASLDSDMLLYGKDSYSYVWPRDGAYNAIALDKAGYSHVTKQFFLFCQSVLHPDGYLHHKFQPDKSLGSTWHSSIKQKDWLENRILQLPIQEDETASVLFALWNHFEHSRDLEFIESLFKTFIEKAANFLLAFRDKKTGLPIHSYDLWEEVTGVSTYTCCTVIGGLRAAAKFCSLLGKENHAETYEAVAEDIRRAMIAHLFDDEIQSFVRYAEITENGVVRHKVVDMSSLYGLWYYDILEPNDELFVATKNAVDQRLKIPGGIGGFVRYESDVYYKEQDHQESNPWIITTLWDLQRRLKYAQSVEEVREHMKDIRWAVDRLAGQPVLAEQFHPFSGEPKSATPLAWSHAVYVETLLLYLKKLEEFGACHHCLPR